MLGAALGAIEDGLTGGKDDSGGSANRQLNIKVVSTSWQASGDLWLPTVNMDVNNASQSTISHATIKVFFLDSFGKEQGMSTVSVSNLFAGRTRTLSAYGVRGFPSDYALLDMGDDANKWRYEVHYVSERGELQKVASGLMNLPPEYATMAKDWEL